MAPAAVSETVGGGLPRVNVWVGMRVRPISRREAATGDVSCWEVQSDGATLVYREPVIRESIPEPEESTKAPLVPPVAFDAAFPPECGGGEVYRVSAQPLVLGACEGVNGTVFAYGQTGSGKTHTMRPLMAAACEEVFGYISRTPGREFLIRVSATEIYNEDLKDLLSLDPSASGLKLMDCPTRGTVAEGLTEVGVESASHLLTLLERVDRNRQERATKQNDSSSRGHLIVKLIMESRPSHHATAGVSGTTMTVMTSALTFVDLAGSERSRQNDDEDKLRLKEGSNINKSLLALGTVIRLLAAGSLHHIPYRNSKLTRILQPALGGNGRTAIICTVSPCHSQLEYTRSTINFAQHAKKVTTQPRVNQVKDTKAQIKSLQNEIAALKDQLEQQQQAAAAALAKSPLQRPFSSPPASVDGTEQADASMAHLQLYKEKLSEKEELVRLTKEQRDAAERRLKGLEKLILRAEPGRPLPSVRASMPSVSLRSLPHPEEEMLSLGKHQANSLAMPVALGAASRASGVAGGASLSRGEMHNMRGSWKPGVSVESYARDMKRSRTKMGLGMGNGGKLSMRIVDESGPLLLDCFLSPSVLKHMKRATSSTSASTMQGAKATAEAEIRKLDVPKGAGAKAALEALQAEVRCMKQTQGGTVDAIKVLQDELVKIEEEKVIGEFLDATKEETIAALHMEINRLKSEKEAIMAADSALNNLKERLKGIRTSQDVDAELQKNGAMGILSPVAGGATPLGAQRAQESPAAGGPGLSPEVEVVFQTTIRSPSSEPLMDSPRASIFGPLLRFSNSTARIPSPLGFSQRTNPEDKENGDGSPKGGRSLSASVATGFRLRKPLELASGSAGDSPSIGLYREELKKVKEFKAAAEKDLEQLQGILHGYQEQAERLDCQKKLLVGQVIKLEYKLDEASETIAGLHQQLEEAEKREQAERVASLSIQEDMAQARRTVAELQAAQAQVPQGVRLPKDINLSMVDPDVDSWAAAPTVETLLPKIVTLWDELSVSLLHRSRFYQHFRGRELFYYEAEYRCLEYCAVQLREIENAKPEEVGALKRRAQKAELKLKWEQNWLVSQLKWEYDNSERLRVFDEWSVPRDTTERKEKLLAKVWSNEVTKNGHDHLGMAKSAELVIRLHGAGPTDGMWDLVFGQEVSKPQRANSAGSLVSGLKALYKKPLKAISTMRSPGGSKTPMKDSPPISRTASMSSRSMSRGGTPRRFPSLPGTPRSTSARTPRKQ